MELADAYPNLRDELLEIVDRLVDLFLGQEGSTWPQKLLAQSGGPPRTSFSYKAWPLTTARWQMPS